MRSIYNMCYRKKEKEQAVWRLKWNQHTPCVEHNLVIGLLSLALLVSHKRVFLSCPSVVRRSELTAERRLHLSMVYHCLCEHQNPFVMLTRAPIFTNNQNIFVMQVHGLVKQEHGVTTIMGRGCNLAKSDWWISGLAPGFRGGFGKWLPMDPS